MQYGFSLKSMVIGQLLFVSRFALIAAKTRLIMPPSLDLRSRKEFSSLEKWNVFFLIHNSRPL
jgi:hypothetical protein